jgi:hypothetical protein
MTNKTEAVVIPPDVFTTNYDTLLERAAEEILPFRYETIIGIANRRPCSFSVFRL